MQAVSQLLTGTSTNQPAVSSSTYGNTKAAKKKLFSEAPYAVCSVSGVYFINSWHSLGFLGLLPSIVDAWCWRGESGRGQIGKVKVHSSGHRGKSSE